MHNHSRTKISQAHLKVFILGCFFTILAVYLYAFHAYTQIIFYSWILGLGMMGYYFFLQRTRSHFYNQKDYSTAFILFCLFGFLYLFNIYSIPRQVNTDEITIMHFMRELIIPVHPDIFALSNYFHFPAMIFIIFGKLGAVMGGITLENIRVIHALSGVSIIIVSYFFFRLFMPIYYAVGATLLLGFNHTLFAISRMAMRDNVATLIEIAGLALLLRSFEKKSVFESYLGGLVVGFGFYNYFPARITGILWAIYLVGVLCFYRHTIDWRWMLRHICAVGVGFFAVVAPVVIATISLPDLGQTYAREQILLTPEGQALQQRWGNSTSIEQGLYLNMINGLFAFNAPIHDHGYIYPNYGNGIVDPLIGILLWYGFFALLVTRNKKREHLLIIFSFLFLMIFFAFITTKNPNYTRFLLLVPFVAGLSAMGFAVLDMNRARVVRVAARIVFGWAVVVSVVLNSIIFTDFVMAGELQGNDVGDTGRYVEARKTADKYHFYLAADERYPYYSWGVASQWQTWLGFFSDNSSQVVEVISPSMLMGAEYHIPFSLFLSRDIASWYEPLFFKQFPAGRMHNITPDGRLKAFEVLE